MINELSISERFRMVAVDDDGERSETIHFRELMDAVWIIRERIASQQHCLIAISMPKHPTIVAAIIAILQSQNAFVYVPPSSVEFVESECARLRVSTLISSIVFSDATEVVLGVKIYFTVYSQNRIEAFEVTPICYVIETSGTTGKPKSVMVPYSAIMPNIRDFRARFSLLPSDVILHSTALSFDPSVVELFLALSIGSELLIVSDSLRSRPAMLANVLLKFHASFVQMTPSLLKLLPHSALVKIFDEKSVLRILLLGGEAFPSKFLSHYISEGTRVNIFNVYGVTEVSCWASCRQWKSGEDEVDIGDPLLDTTFRVDSAGQLLIGGQRRCFLDGQLAEEWTPTGDVVERRCSGKLFWKGRCDDQIKVNGIRVNLTEIVNAVERVDGVYSAIAIGWRNKAVVLFVKGQHADIANNLRKQIPPKWFPHAIVPLSEWPLNRHGKVDRDALLKIFEQQNSLTKREDIASVLANYGIDTIKHQTATFHSLGLTSLYATELMFKLEHLLKEPNFSLLPFLLSETSTVGDLLGLLHLDGALSSDDRSECFETITEISPLKGIYESSLIWEWDSLKCIDATPIVHEGRVFIGSHSGRFVSINIIDGHKNWEIRLPNRIEATAALQYGIIAVGCYDHFVYFIDQRNGTIVWSFETGDIIKATPTFVAEGECIVASHDHFAYLLDYNNRTKRWQLQCDGGILAKPTLLHNFAIIASLSGKLICASLKAGIPSWEVHVGSPLFASICLVEEGRNFIVADVRGNVSLRDCFTGSEIESFAVNESIFAVPQIINSSMGVLLTQCGSVIFFHIQSFSIYKCLRIKSSSFVRPPVLINDATIFLNNTTGQLFALELSKVISKRRKESPYGAISDSEEQRASEKSLSNAASEHNGIDENSVPDQEDLSQSVAEVLSQIAETFGGVVIIENKEDGEENSSSYRAIIGTRSNRLRCFNFMKKSVS
uniref:AMP-dependent synthetase/ligase domain-containing protein n=1 Tax=Parascaris univalens TaxID=6257 RepID=A0A915BNA9_PARUN